MEAVVRALIPTSDLSHGIHLTCQHRWRCLSDTVISGERSARRWLGNQVRG